MVPSPPAPPSGRDDAGDPTPGGADHADRVDRVDEAIASALAVLDGRAVADPGAGPTRRVVTVLDAILAARAAAR